MMNPFTLHTQQQGVSYTEHMIFAMGIAYRLSRSVIAFTLHAIFPFLNIEVDVDLESTAAFIEERNNWIEERFKKQVEITLGRSVGEKKRGRPKTLERIG